MDKVDVQAWLKGEVDGIVKLYVAGKRREAFEAFSAVVGKGRFESLAQMEKEAAFLKPLEVFASKWEEKEGLVIAGRIRAWMEDYLSANKKYELAIALDPGYAIAFNYRANTHAELGDKEKALLDYDKAIALDPKYAIAFNYRGNTHSELGDKQKALLDYDKAIALDPEDATAYYNRGVTHSELGDNKKALLDYDKAIALDPEDVTAYNNRGIAHSDLGDKQKSLLDYDKAIALNPSQASAYYNRSLILEEQVDFKEATQDLEKFLELSTDPFWIERAKARLVELDAKLKHPAVRKVGALVEDIRKLLRFEGAEITHYTSFTAAKLMILDKSPFRMSEATFMNDPSEGTVLLGFLFKGKADPLDEGHFDGRFVGKPFFGSFVDASANMQDDLGMWRLYGKENGAEAAGTSLTFDSQALVDALLQTEQITEKGGMGQAKSGPFELFKMAYLTPDDEVVLPGEDADAEKKLKKALDELKKVLSPATLKRLDTESRISVRRELADIMYLFKSAQYQYEKEVRLMLKPAGFKVNIEREADKPMKVYISIAPIHKALRCMTLGPKVPKGEEWLAVLYYELAKEGLKPSLHASRLPYK